MKCKHCGCTDRQACPGGCSWFAPEICSVCTKRAVLSPCGRFRYRLDRELAPAGIVVAFFGVNPSTADAELEDQTTKKWEGFARRMGARSYIAGNAFGFRATNVHDLITYNPDGPDNARHQAEIIAEADLLVPCWGRRNKVPVGLRDRISALALRIRESGKPVRVFGLTKSGDPKHPLMLGYTTPLIEWVAP